MAGGLDDGHNCEVGIVYDSKTGARYGGQVAQSVLEVSLFEETGFVNELSGEIRLSDGIVARVTDRSVSDSMRGTYVWENIDTEGPETLVQLYRGPIRIFVNNSDSASFRGG